MFPVKNYKITSAIFGFGPAVLILLQRGSLVLSAIVTLMYAVSTV